MKYLPMESVKETMDGTTLYNRLMAAVDDIRWNDRIESNKPWIFSTQRIISSFINRRQRQILVHSYIYYVLDQNLIDDCTWSKWAQELVDISAAYPDIAAQSEFANDFEDFDGSTGAFFDFENVRMIGIISAADWLLH